MTRFARAKGSKSSNERVPESATPWNQMKQQLLDKNKEIAEQKHRQHAIDKRNANYKAFLQEKEDEETKNVQWASFPAEAPLQIAKKKKSKNNISFGEGSKQSSFSNSFDENMDDELSDNDETFLALKEKLDQVLSEPKSKINNSQGDDSDVAPEEQSSKVQISAPSVKIKKPKKKKIPLKIESVNSNNDENTTKPEKKPKKRKANEESTTNNKKPKVEGNDKNKHNVDTKLKKVKDKKVKKEQSNIQIGGEIKKNKKVKKEQLKKQKGGDQPKKVVKENLSEDDIRKIEKKKQKKLKQLEKRKKAKAERKKQKEEEEKSKTENGEVVNEPEIAEEKNNNKITSPEKPKDFKKFNRPNKFNNKFEKKNPKTKDGKEGQRKKPYLPSKMIINGKEVEVDYIEGFPVKKEDATRLKKLRKEMISKGLPRSEINIALKLERRRAEKAFAREKKKVCFNCRKSGHNLSECPQLNKDQVATSASGICFKCGSTEHTHFECKVVRGQDFKYAQCFICNEQGHISRQCPDNARGLYPKGGSCNVCGDVTHLKKDCPKYQAQQQHLQSSLNIETIGSSNPDILDNENNTNKFSLGHQRPNKIIKF